MSRVDDERTSAALDDNNGAHPLAAIVEVVERLDPLGAEIKLGSHSRLNQSMVSKDDFILVREGTAALEAVPSGGRRQVLDFMMSGDAIPAAIVRALPGFHLRALTAVTLDCHVVTNGNSATPLLQYPVLVNQLQRHLARRNLHQIIIGQLDSEARICSFLLVQAVRQGRAAEPGMVLDLPMSRDDIADHLAMNPDTLSRLMMRLEAQGLIERINRHAVKLLDVPQLGTRTPLRNNFIALMVGSAPQHHPYE